MAMAAGFDANDKDSWYHGPMTRQDATDLLMSEQESGVFLVRDSASIKGDYVLCVKEDAKVSHYIIHRMNQGDLTTYKIGDQKFSDLASLLNFYRLHYLDSTPLTRAAPRRIHKVIAKYDFDGRDPDDLSFTRGEVLVVISKDEEQWWTARNSLGQTGSIPVPYVQRYDESNHHTVVDGRSSLPNSQTSNGSVSKPNNTPSTTAPIRTQRKLPAAARVIQDRVPNAYDGTALTLRVGDIVDVTKMNMNGQWEGILNGKHGHFPFNHVEFLDDDDGRDAQS